MNAEDRDPQTGSTRADDELTEAPNPGGIRGFFRPAPKKPKTGGSTKSGKKNKPAKPKSAAELRREREKANRRIKRGVRYGGGRRALMAILGLMAAAVLLAVAALAMAASKPTQADVEAAVDDRLTTSGYEFPQGEAVMWAGQVLRVWGTWDSENPEARAVALAPYLSSGMDAQAGWNEEGTQKLIYASVNPEPLVTSENHASVEAVYQIGDGSWRCVSIPTYAYHPEDPNLEQEWAFSLAGNPTPVPCAPRTGAPSLDDAAAPGQDPEGMVPDDELAATLSESFFPGFFSAWAGSNSNALEQFTASGVTLTGLGGAMASTPQPVVGESLVWVDEGGPQDGKVYYAYVPVTWTITGTDTSLTAAYVVPVKRDQDRWFVAGEPMSAEQSTDVGGGAPVQIPAPDTEVAPEAFPEAQPSSTGEPKESSPSDGSSPSPTSSASASPSSTSSASARSSASASATPTSGSGD